MDTFPADVVLQKIESQHESCAITERYVRSQSVVSRRIAGETLIVPVRGKVGDLASIYSFNGSGTLLWESLASPKSFADLVEAIERQYAVERAYAERDVKQFLNDAATAGLIEVQKPIAMADMAETRFVSGHDLSL